MGRLFCMADGVSGDNSTSDADTSTASVSRYPYQEHIEKAAKVYQIRPTLVAAMVQVESGWDPWAHREEPGWRHMVTGSASGLGMEPFLAPTGVPIPARGFRLPPSAPVCTKATEWTAQRQSWGLLQVMGAVCREVGHVGWLTRVCDPEVGLAIGCQHLAGFLARYPEAEAVAAYNAGAGGRRSDAGVAYYQRVRKAEEQILDGEPAVALH